MTEKSDRVDASDETLKGLISLRSYLAERISVLQEELGKIAGSIEVLDEAIAALTFRSPVIPAKTIEHPAVETAEKSRGKEGSEGIPLRSRTGELLAQLIVGERSARIIPQIQLSVSMPPFQSFLVNQILEPMRQRDQDLFSDGQIAEDRVFSYSVIVSGEELKEISVRNIDQQRLREIRSAARWTLEKMQEKANP